MLKWFFIIYFFFSHYRYNRYSLGILFVSRGRKCIVHLQHFFGGHVLYVEFKLHEYGGLSINKSRPGKV